MTTQFCLIAQWCWIWAWGQQHSLNLMSNVVTYRYLHCGLCNLSLVVLFTMDFPVLIWQVSSLELDSLIVLIFLWCKYEMFYGTVWKMFGGWKESLHFPCMHVRVLWLSAIVRFESGSLVQKLRADRLLKCSSVTVRGSVWIQLVFTFLPGHPVPDSPLFETQCVKKYFFAHTVSLVFLFHKVHQMLPMFFCLVWVPWVSSVSGATTVISSCACLPLRLSFKMHSPWNKRGSATSERAEKKGKHGQIFKIDLTQLISRWSNWAKVLS